MSYLYSITSFFKKVKTVISCVCFFLLFCATASRAQLIVHADNSAAALVDALVGSGVTIMSPTLSCAGNANGIFTTVSSTLGIPNGIVLTTGCAVDTTLLGGPYYGVANPAADFASCDNSWPGDAQLTTLAGQPTYDACILQFNFKPAGDSVKFNFAFGSEEYAEWICSEYNDVFAFFITGGAYGATAKNLAVVPGTSIPVCINSVNCGPSPDYSISGCQTLGPGVPFCAYYAATLDAATIVYDGMTYIMQANAAVSPCDTYHLKIAIADAGDGIWDSGVFLEGGSLSSPTTASVKCDGPPFCIRGCNPGVFTFSTSSASDTPVIIHYAVTGTAVNGYDYNTITDSVIIPPGADSTTITITPTPIAPAGAKTVTLEILIPNTCDTGYAIGSSATITIYDSLTVNIITPDTIICNGQSVHITAVGNSAFDTLAEYSWLPSATLNNDAILDPIATPTVTTSYTITATLPAVYGCSPAEDSITVGVAYVPVLSIDSSYILACGGTPVTFNLSVSPSTQTYSYIWSPSVNLNSDTVQNPVCTPTAPGDVLYTVIVTSTIGHCSSSDTLRVHTVPNNFLLNNSDTAICVGQSVQTSITGSNEFNYTWAPPAGVSNPSIMEPVITPTVSAVYTVTATYAACPPMSHSFGITVYYPAPAISIEDTICKGQSDSLNVMVPDTSIYKSVSYSYAWSPGTFLSNVAIPNPVCTPDTFGTFNYVVDVSVMGIPGCSTIDNVSVTEVPHDLTLLTPDTAICLGSSVQINAKGNTGDSYQWLPTAGIPVSDIINPVITPDTSAEYIITAINAHCAPLKDSLYIDVQPNPFVYAGGNRFVCQFDTLHLRASVVPGWYQYYSYQWSPGGAVDDSTMQNVVYASDTNVEITVTVTTPAGCKGLDSLHITNYPGNFASITPENAAICPGDSVQLTASGGVAYHWYPSDFLNDSVSPTPMARPISTQYYYAIVSSIYGCRDTVGVNITVYPAAVLNLGDSVILYPGESYQFNPETNCLTFAWFPQLGLSDPSISNPVAMPDVSTKYIVHASTEAGCTTIDSVDVDIDPGTLLAIPNAFTPGNGPNNIFKIIKRGIATLNYFRIFNRWGNMVFETTNIDDGWDGSYNGTPQPFDVYVYEVEAVTNTGKIFKKQGNVTLIR